MSGMRRRAYRLVRLLYLAVIAALAGIVVYIAWPTTLTQAAVYLFAAAGVLVIAGFVILLRRTEN